MVYNGKVYLLLSHVLAVKNRFISKYIQLQHETIPMSHFIRHYRNILSSITVKCVSLPLSPQAPIILPLFWRRAKYSSQAGPHLSPVHQFLWRYHLLFLLGWLIHMLYISVSYDIKLKTLTLPAESTQARWQLPAKWEYTWDFQAAEGFPDTVTRKFESVTYGNCCTQCSLSVPTQQALFLSRR